MNKEFQIQENIRLLQQTFNILQALIREKESLRDGKSYSDIFQLSWVAKYVYERMETEQAKLPRLRIPPESPLASTIRGPD